MSYKARVRKPPRLVAGPYESPRLAVGAVVTCSIRPGEDLVVAGHLGGPIPWPFAVIGLARYLPVFGELERAVRNESARAVCWYFGVSHDTVTKWRKALGVDRYNAGTRALWSDLTRKRLGPPAEAARKSHKARGL